MNKKNQQNLLWELENKQELVIDSQELIKQSSVWKTLISRIVRKPTR